MLHAWIIAAFQARRCLSLHLQRGSSANGITFSANSIMGTRLMKRASLGDTARVHYTVKLEDGTIVESSEDQEPLECVLGGGTLIPGFEQGILGMSVGDHRSITVDPELGYGPPREDLQFKIPRSDFPEDLIPFVGQMLQIQEPGEEPVSVTVRDISEDSIVLDANHPLAETVLLFDIELVELL